MLHWIHINSELVLHEGGKRKTPGFEERTPLTKIVVAVSPVVKKKVQIVAINIF